MRIFKNNKKLIIGLAIFVALFIVQKILYFNYMLLICEPAPYCRYLFYESFPIFTVVLIKSLPWLQIIGSIILVWALGEKIINWVKKRKDKNN